MSKILVIFSLLIRNREMEHVSREERSSPSQGGAKVPPLAVFAVREKLAQYLWK
jgi:hypothetical protein